MIKSLFLKQNLHLIYLFEIFYKKVITSVKLLNEYYLSDFNINYDIIQIKTLSKF